MVWLRVQFFFVSDWSQGLQQIVASFSSLSDYSSVSNYFLYGVYFFSTDFLNHFLLSFLSCTVHFSLPRLLPLFPAPHGISLFLRVRVRDPRRHVAAPKFGSFNILTFEMWQAGALCLHAETERKCHNTTKSGLFN
jgi:hypothetical protein